MVTLFDHNQIAAYEAAVAIRHETGKAAGAEVSKSIEFVRLMNMTDLAPDEKTSVLSINT